MSLDVSAAACVPVFAWHLHFNQLDVPLIHYAATTGPLSMYQGIAIYEDDRYPELWPDYFGHYRRLVWLAQQPTPALAAEAERVAAMFGLPLTRVEVGVSRLEDALASLVEEAA